MADDLGYSIKSNNGHVQDDIKECLQSLISQGVLEFISTVKCEDIDQAKNNTLIRFNVVKIRRASPDTTLIYFNQFLKICDLCRIKNINPASVFNCYLYIKKYFICNSYQIDLSISVLAMFAKKSPDYIKNILSVINEIGLYKITFNGDFAEILIIPLPGCT